MSSEQTVLVLEASLHERMRAFQLAYWYRAQVVGELRKNEPQEPGLESMLSDFAPSAERSNLCSGNAWVSRPLVCAESPDSEALSELFSSD